MKVLFAVNNESISETIIKKYQKSFDELLEYKNVYYYNAIIKELQRENDYDLIVISEDLETISSTDKTKIDAFILDKLEKIVNVLKTEKIGSMPILFIANEKRIIKDAIIPTMFNLGIYNALIGRDRTITKICELISKPRNEIEAREYYNLGIAEKSNIENEIVNPKEVNNILRHYKKIMSMPNRFSSSFDRIAEQYDELQLKYIIEKLPEEVTSVLNVENAKFKEVSNADDKSLREKIADVKANLKEAKSASNSGIVIPGEVSKTKVKSQTKEVFEPEIVIPEEPEIKPQGETKVNLESEGDVSDIDGIFLSDNDLDFAEDVEETEDEQTEVVIEGLDDDLDIFVDLPTEDSEEDFVPIFGDTASVDIDEDDDIVIKLDDIEIDVEDDESVSMDLEISELNNDEINIFGNELLDDETGNDFVQEIEIPEVSIETDIPVTEKTKGKKKTEKVDYEKDLVSKKKKTFVNPDLSSVLSKDKKVVAFVGTSKNGTSFTVNSLGMMFASIGIKTAILDMTTNKNSYYLATKNDERLRQIAIDSINKLREGIAMGVDVIRGLSVYTALPGSKDEFDDSEKILSTLVKNYSLVLIDTDFNTDFSYFSAAQEIYLVQSLDVLTIQPLTAFLKELLDAGVLTTEKVKVVLNKEVPVRGLTRKLLVGGLSTYNDPAMSIMTNLFDRNQVQVASIPFDQNVYSKYLENIVECKYDISGYPKKFVEALKVLANMVYPLISKQRDVNVDLSLPRTETQTPTGAFSNDMSSTLDQMRKNL